MKISYYEKGELDSNNIIPPRVTDLEPNYLRSSIVKLNLYIDFIVYSGSSIEFQNTFGLKINESTVMESMKLY
jgi:hypothetical protein